jgi:hypothetical protein
MLVVTDSRTIIVSQAANSFAYRLHGSSDIMTYFLGFPITVIVNSIMCSKSYRISFIIYNALWKKSSLIDAK